MDSNNRVKISTESSFSPSKDVFKEQEREFELVKSISSEMDKDPEVR
jgi:hypothetical protein